MSGFRSHSLSLCLILVLKLTATKQRFSSVLVKGGDEARLSCENMIDQNSCLRTNWLFSKLAQTSAIDLVKFGQTQVSRSRDRLSLSANCSLIIQRVTAADLGTYHCQQFLNNNVKENTTSVVLYLVNSLHLPPPTVTEHEDDDEVTLSCSVLPNALCKHSLKWLLKGRDIDKNNKDLETEQSSCAAKVTFLTSHYVYEPGRYNSLRCEVTEFGATSPQLFVFGSQTSGRVNQQSEHNETQPSGVWWFYIIVAVSLVTCLLVAWLLIKRRRKGNKTQVDENLDEPDATISYASIILPKKNNNQIRGSDAAVTYSAVKVEASPDPSDHYASVR